MERPENQPARAESAGDYFMNLQRLARERIEQELQALAQEGILSESGMFTIPHLICCRSNRANAHLTVDIWLEIVQIQAAPRATKMTTALRRAASHSRMASSWSSQRN